MLTLGGKVTGLRRDRGFSQRELAHKTGVAQSTISLVERGKRLPDLVTLQKLAAALGTSAAEVLDGVQA